MNRCVVCGAVPAEECNQRTHDVHYRMWWERAEWGESPQAIQLIAAIDAARAKDAA